MKHFTAVACLALLSSTAISVSRAEAGVFLGGSAPKPRIDPSGDPQWCATNVDCQAAVTYRQNLFGAAQNLDAASTLIDQSPIGGPYGSYLKSVGSGIADGFSRILKSLAADPPRFDYFNPVSRGGPLDLGFSDPISTPESKLATAGFDDLLYSLQSYQLYLEAVEKSEGAFFDGNAFYLGQRLNDGANLLLDADIRITQSRQRLIYWLAMGRPNYLIFIVNSAISRKRLVPSRFTTALRQYPNRQPGR